jgi:hypothetical protein
MPTQFGPGALAGAAEAGITMGSTVVDTTSPFAAQPLDPILAYPGALEGDAS